MSYVLSKRGTEPAQAQNQRKIGLLEKLHLLQINGNLRDRKTCSKLRVFEYFPRRLVFRLSDLIEGDDWKSESIFLGFTQDGQFIISYSCQYGYGENQLVVNKLYHLQWWLFVPYKPLKKVREIRLFGDQEINEDIHLAVCQWPTDNTKILVYGYCSYRRNEDPETTRWCYITIMAIPPLRPCANCSALNSQDSLIDENEEEDPNENRRKLCLKHSFIVHTRYIRVPPFPSFNPYISMKIDGLVIINTGDNLIVLSVGIQCAKHICAIDSSSIKNLEAESSIDDLKPLSIFCDEELTDDFFSPCRCPMGTTSPSSRSSNYLSLEDNLKSYNGTDLCGECRKQLKRCGRLNKIEEHRVVDFSTISKRNKSDSFGESLKELVYHHPEVSVESGGGVGSGGKEEERNSDVKCLTRQLNNAWRTDHVQDIPLEDLKETPPPPPPPPPTTTLTSTGQLNYYRNCEKENISPKSVRMALAVNTPRLLSPRERKSGETGGGGKNNEENKDLKTNDGALAMPFSMAASQASGFSGEENNERLITGEVDPQREGNCVSENQQYFGVWEDNNSSHFEEDSASTEYHNVLSFEVFGIHYKLMKALNPERLPNWKNSAVAVHHLTFDIEQFAHEMAQKICNEAGKKYLAFLDYDVQIIDVCEVSQNAIALVVMQVQAMVGQKGVAKELRSSVRKVFQTGFKFEWNIKTGIYSIIDIDELNEVHPSAANVNNGRFWNPASLMVNSLLKDWYIPHFTAKSVRVMTNDNVPSGESLKVIWAPSMEAAIIL